MSTEDELQTTPKHRLNLSLDYRIVIFVLLAVIVAMVIIWKPWSSADSSDRTVQVTGEAKLKAEADEFVFYPNYQFTNPDKTAALEALTKKADEITAKLKELGVEDSKIKSNSDGYDRMYYPVETEDSTYSLQLTITVSNREMAQKIQDYLVTTQPTGAVSPQPTFSDQKRKELESQARDAATKDARSKADQSAKNLGFKVGKVKQVTDGAGFGILLDGGLESTDSARPQLKVQPGENELNYSVTVVYFVR